MSDNLSDKDKCNRFIPNEDECKKRWPFRCPPRTEWSAIGAVATFVLIGIVLWVLRGQLALAVAMVGGIVFFATLALADYSSPDVGVSTGEMRSAISATIIVVYIIIVALSFGGNLSTVDSKIIDTLSSVVITVVGFYFGSKGAIELLGKYQEGKKGKDSSQ